MKRSVDDYFKKCGCKRRARDNLLVRRECEDKGYFNFYVKRYRTPIIGRSQERRS